MSPEQKAGLEFKPVLSSRPLRSLVGAILPSKNLLPELAPHSPALSSASSVPSLPTRGRACSESSAHGGQDCL